MGMCMKFNRIRVIIIAILVIVTMYACASTGSLRNENTKLYYESMDRMIQISRNALENKGYAVTNIHERREANRRSTIAFVNRAAAGQQLVSSMESNIHLAEVDTVDAVFVRIDNPNYNFATPTDQRIDHASILFEEIENLLD